MAGEEQAARICFAWCHKCCGGENSGWCHHVVMLVIGLMQFQMGIIGTGQYNGGDRAWGNHHLLIDMPSLTSQQISLLFPEQHALRLFRGIKFEFVTLRYLLSTLPILIYVYTLNASTHAGLGWQMPSNSFKPTEAKS